MNHSPSSPETLNTESINGNTSRYSFHEQVRAVVLIQRIVKRWLSRKKSREEQQLSLLHASVTEDKEKKKLYKSLKQKTHTQVLHKQQQLDLSSIVNFEKLKNIIPVPLPELTYLKQQLPLNHFRSIGRNNYLIALNDPKHALFSKIERLFKDHMKVPPGKFIKIHRIQIIWNQKQQDEFLKLEQYYTNKYYTESRTSSEGKQASPTSTQNSTSPSATSPTFAESFNTFTPLQRMYLRHLDEHIFQNESHKRFSNVVTNWLPLNDERKQEYIAKHGILMRDRRESIDDVTTLPRLYGNGLYFQLERPENLETIIQKYRRKLEKEQIDQMHSAMSGTSTHTARSQHGATPPTSNNGTPLSSRGTPLSGAPRRHSYNTTGSPQGVAFVPNTPIKKLVNSATPFDDPASSNHILNSPRTPRTPRGSPHNITFLGCFLLAGHSFPLTNVKEHGSNVKGFDSTYVCLRKKPAEAAFCTSYEEYEEMKSMGPQFFPVEDEKEPSESEQLVIFDERAVLPQFLVTCSVERDTRSNTLATDSFKKASTTKKLKQVILTHKKKPLPTSPPDQNAKDSSVQPDSTNPLQVDQYDSISAAIDYGEKIVVLPGTYEADEVMLSRSQIIKGSKKEKCVLSLSGHMVVYNAVVNMTIRCSDPEFSGSVNLYLLGETALLKNCIIDGVNVIVSSGTQERLISSCIVRGNASIEVSHSSILTIQRSRINCSPGIIVKDDATCHLVQVGVDRASVSVQGKARLTANQNTIFKQSKYCIVANDTTDLELNKVTFKQIQECAIYCLDECEMTLNDCNFINCPGVCLQVKNLTLANISHTVFKQCGIALECLTQEQQQLEETDGALIITQNTFVDTNICLLIRSGKPKVHNNKFLNCASSVTSGGQSSCDFRDNVLHNSPFDITSRSTPIIKSNQFTLDSKLLSCIVASSLSSPTIKRNTFGAPHGQCILVRQASHPQVENNSFLNSQTALLVNLNHTAQKAVHISRNTFKSCKTSIQAGCEEADSFSFSKRESTSPLKDSVFFQLVAEDNVFENSECAIQSLDDSTLKIKKNTFHSCASGISLDDNSNAHIKKCNFIAMRESSIVSFKNAQGSVRKNEFGESDSRSYSVHVRGSSHLSLHDNTFLSMNSIHAKENSSVHVSSNFFYVHEHAFTIGNSASATLDQNTFEPLQVARSARSTVYSGEDGEDTSSELSSNMGESPRPFDEDMPDLPIPETPRDEHSKILLPAPTIHPLNIEKVSTLSSIADFADALCIEAFDSARLTVTKNTFRGENKIPHALFTTGSTQVEVRDNNFSKFSSWTCHLAGRSECSLHENVFTTQNGVRVEDDLCKALVISNRFTQCELGVDLEDSSEHCELSSNMFEKCFTAVSVGGGGTISNNTFNSSSSCAVQFCKRSKAICSENTFKSQDVSVIVRESAHPEITSNRFEKHTVALILKDSSDCSITKNFFTSETGISITDSSKGTVSDNEFSSQSLGITITNFGSVSVNGNSFSNCARCIEVCTERLEQPNPESPSTSPNTSSGLISTIVSNSFKGYDSAVLCLSSSHVQINGNNFYACNPDSSLACVSLRDTARGSLVENSFEDSQLGVSLIDHTFMYISQNNFSNMRDFAILYSLEHSIVNRCTHNHFSHCRIGLSIVDQSCVSMKLNTFSDMTDAAMVCRGVTQTLVDEIQVENSPMGIHTKAASLVNISDSNFSNCEIPIRISEESGVSLHNSQLSNGKFGVLSEQNSFFIAFQVVFSKFQSTGVYLTDTSNSVISGCQFEGLTHKFAIYADARATGRILGESIDPYSGDLENDSTFFILPIIVDYSAEQEVELMEQGKDTVALLSQRAVSCENVTDLTDRSLPIIEYHDTLSLNRNKFLSREDLLLKHRTRSVSASEACIVLCSQSRFEIRGVHATMSAIGILLADQSTSFVTECNISKCRIGIAAMTTDTNTHLHKNQLTKNERAIVLGRDSKLLVSNNKISRNTSGLVAQGKSEIRGNTLIFNRKNIELGWNAHPVLVKNKARALCQHFPWFCQFIPFQFAITSSFLSLHALLILYYAYLLVCLLLQLDPFNFSAEGAPLQYWVAIIAGLTTSLLNAIVLSGWNLVMLLRKRLEFDFSLVALILSSFSVNAIFGAFFRVAPMYDDESDWFSFLVWLLPCIQVLVTFGVYITTLFCCHIYCLKRMGFQADWFLRKTQKPLLLGSEKRNPLHHDHEALQILISPPSVPSVVSPEDDDQTREIVVFTPSKDGDSRDEENAEREELS